MTANQTCFIQNYDPSALMCLLGSISDFVINNHHSYLLNGSFSVYSPLWMMNVIYVYFLRFSMNITIFHVKVSL